MPLFLKREGTGKVLRWAPPFFVAWIGSSLNYNSVNGKITEFRPELQFGHQLIRGATDREGPGCFPEVGRSQEPSGTGPRCKAGDDMERASVRGNQTHRREVRRSRGGGVHCGG